ncbi:MAG: dephospho-CoA kinase, partial [Clostridiales bacterium]|nr:dephospho-CoA kinase [Clostridiales bacterium]
QIVEEFGDGILAEDGSIHRPTLSAIVFADSEKLEKLNQITHPNVRKEIERRIEQYRLEANEAHYHLIAVEAALFIESGYDDMLDELWYVYADETTRIERLMEGRGHTEEQSRSSMKDQLSEETFRSHCDRVIDNSGTVEELRRQLEKLLAYKEQSFLP